ncbi:MAG: low molecular weight phosphotyrosine protein phosphatase [Okeania sp. SIO3I5]|uniref:low molecular weight protein-tyrosine-phosphatase n=1 Tax=Okeania sp. SIO3I5 TaxID=2607805 RepID=UPI0013B8542B|nr:low molecular weight protein-tyrosine-phosphatase [Okeania sp. SIO3I5]NEQ36210.1 low molecular weight phosphotyrosine protein phosphatase [Okeania sp. SIO3I5]
MPYKLLFVCLGNICRSPSAENIMNHLIEKANLSDSLVCDSAGTAGYHIGSSPDSRMTYAAKMRGINLKGSARKFKVEDFNNFDLILTMDKENYRDVLRLDSAGKYGDKVKLMCEFCRDFDVKEVPDPYYGGSDGFDYVIEILLDACEGLLDYLRNQNKIVE